MRYVLSIAAVSVWMTTPALASLELVRQRELGLTIIHFEGEIKPGSFKDLTQLTSRAAELDPPGPAQKLHAAKRGERDAQHNLAVVNV
jgi:hypothetical protein